MVVVAEMVVAEMDLETEQAMAATVLGTAQDMGLGTADFPTVSGTTAERLFHSAGNRFNRWIKNAVFRSEVIPFFQTTFRRDGFAVNNIKIGK